MARAVWVDSEGNRYHRHLESVTKKCRASGTRILVRRVHDMDGVKAEAVMHPTPPTLAMVFCYRRQLSSTTLVPYLTSGALIMVTFDSLST